MSHFTTIEFRTNNRQELYNLTTEVQKFVEDSGVQDGLCAVYCPHTTAGLVVNSHMDPNTAKDIVTEIDRVIPTRVDFFHMADTPSDAAAHVKASLVDVNKLFVIDGGQIVLGHSQGILFAEFDGPRNRKVLVKLLEG